jgi:RNA polymerase sigma factor (TIGR02999 family)
VKDVTQILQALEQGDARAAHELLPLVYEELRKLAASKMAHEPPGQTLQPTALVHEAWLRVSNKPQQQWDSRAHFFGAAAEAMRRILIDKARRKQALRHGAGRPLLDVQELEIAAPAPEEQLLAINEALDKLAAASPQKAQLVKLRYFAGLSVEEAAQMLQISEATAKRWWAYARAWLLCEIQTQTPDPRAKPDLATPSFPGPPASG